MHGTSERTKFARVVAKIDPTASLLKTWSLRGGISNPMTALEIELENGKTKRMIVRQPEGAMRDDPRAATNEFRLLQLLISAGLPVPEPRLLDESAEIFPEPYLVVEYIDGEPDCAPADVSDFISQLAARLVEIHRVDADVTWLPPYTPRFIHHRSIRATPHHSLDVGRIRAALASEWPARQRNPSVLLHGDYWPGNVLWKDARITGVIDWEESCIGDPMTDLAITRLEMVWAFGMEAMHEFTRRYQSLSGFDLGDLPYWDLDAALRPVFNIDEWAAGWPDLGRSDVTEATLRVGHRQFVGQAFDALLA